MSTYVIQVRQIVPHKHEHPHLEVARIPGARLLNTYQIGCADI